jgi:SAM-dependent methyltransferase
MLAFHSEERLMASQSIPDFKAITDQQQAAWSAGDFHALALPIMEVSEQLIYAVDPRPGRRVLDVACGTGNGALIAARRYCEVTGLDFAANLIERARMRAQAEGVPAKFIEGDAQALPFKDAYFDHVVSTFGVMFAPHQELAASELLRVTKPGGRIGLANWMPDDFGGKFFGLISSYKPLPPGMKPGTRWGTEKGAKELLGAGARSLKVESRTFTMLYPSVDYMVNTLLNQFGPLVKLSANLDEPKREALRQDLTQLLTELNTADDGTLALRPKFALVTAERA